MAIVRRRLVIHGANQVAQADELGLSDPYAVVWWNGRKVGSTAPCFETLDPRWDEKFKVDLAENQGANFIRIELYDQDNADRDDFLGQVEVQLPGGRADDAFVERTYKLGRRRVHTMPVKTSMKMEGSRRLKTEGSKKRGFFSRACCGKQVRSCLCPTKEMTRR